MCELSRLGAGGTSRRAFLSAGAATAAALAVPAGVAGAEPTGAAVAGRYRTRLVLLGTAGGPTWRDLDRAGIASAVVVGDAVYLVDCGDGVGRQLFRAGLDLADLRGIFVTHLHSDHVSDYWKLQLYGWFQNLEQARRPVPAYGPSVRGELPPVFGDPEQEPPVINPENPTPGLVDMSGYLLQAYATDINDRMRDNLKTDLRELVVPHDIELPSDVDAHPNDNPAPDMAPFLIMEDERVRVTATLVYHAPVFPAYAFRFDTEEGSVVFSGDTGMSDNLVRLATGADVLVHEVIDPEWVRSLFGPNPTPEQEALINHLLTAHTPTEDAGRVAERAGVRTLVLNHFVPGDNPRHRWLAAKKTYSGTLVVGADLDQVGVGTPMRP